jgi:hypothetical protein
MVYRHSPLQLSFESFGAGLSTPLSSNNEWIQLAEVMPWKALDEAYQLEFTKNAGRAGKTISFTLWGNPDPTTDGFN